MIPKKVILKSSRVILDKKRSRIFDITGIFTSVLTRLKIQKQLVQVTSIQMILRTYIQIQVMLKRNLPMLLIHSWIIHFWCMVSQWIKFLINSHLEGPSVNPFNGELWPKYLSRIIGWTAKPSRFNKWTDKIDFLFWKKAIFVTISGTFESHHLTALLESQNISRTAYVGYCHVN